MNKNLPPPIKDLNDDGILQGSELRSQLKAEEENGSARTKNEKVHGVLEAMGIRGAAKEYANAILYAQIGDNPNKDVSELQKIGADIIKNTLETGAEMTVQPKFQELLKIDAEQTKNNKGLTEEQKSIHLSDLNNANEFAKTFKTTFPKGVAIEREDVTELLGHFASIPVVITKPIEQRGKNTDDGVSF